MVQVKSEHDDFVASTHKIMSSGLGAPSVAFAGTILLLCSKN